MVLSPSGEYFLVVSNNTDRVDVWSCAGGYVCSITSGARVSSWGFTKDSSKAAVQTGNTYMTADLFPSEDELFEKVRMLAGY